MEGAWCALASPRGGQSPPLFPACLALISALDRDAQQPLCYASKSRVNFLLDSGVFVLSHVG
jgi:hypothetical protein